MRSPPERSRLSFRRTVAARRIVAGVSPVRPVLARAEHHGGRVRPFSFDRHGAVRQAQFGPRPDPERRPSSFPGRIRPGQDDVDPFQLERTRPKFEPDRRRGRLFGIGRGRPEADSRAGLPGLRADAPAALAPELGAREDPIGVCRHEQALAARGRPTEGVPEFLGGPQWRRAVVDRLGLHGVRARGGRRHGWIRRRRPHGLGRSGSGSASVPTRRAGHPIAEAKDRRPSGARSVKSAGTSIGRGRRPSPVSEGIGHGHGHRHGRARTREGPAPRRATVGGLGGRCLFPSRHRRVRRERDLRGERARGAPTCPRRAGAARDRGEPERLAGIVRLACEGLLRVGGLPDGGLGGRRGALADRRGVLGPEVRVADRLPAGIPAGRLQEDPDPRVQVPPASPIEAVGVIGRHEGHAARRAAGRWPNLRPRRGGPSLRTGRRAPRPPGC